MRHKPAFTFVEVLVASLLCSILAFAIAGVMLSGFKLWHRVGDNGGFNSQGILEVENMGRDLRQSLSCKEIPFKGNVTDIEFAGIENGGLSKISYSYDGESNKLSRQSRFYSDILKDVQPPQPQFVLKNVNVIFAYLVNTTNSGFQWQESFNDISAYPIAVNITIGSSGNKIVKTVFIPTVGN